LTQPIGTPPPGWRGFYPTYLRIATDGMEGILKASRLMRSRGTPVTAWENYARRFGDWLVTHQNADGSYYRSYNLAGTAPDNQAKYNTHNAVPFLMELSAYTGDTRYRTAALRAGEFAYNTVHTPAAYVGGTPDNNNVEDKEAACLALRAFLALYDGTKGQRWLQAAQRAADFAETWAYAWNYPVNSNRPAYSKYGVRGQSLIATGHSAMDSWHSGTLYDFYRLYRATNDAHYLKYARQVANETKLSTQWPGNPLGYARDGLEEAIGLADLVYGGVNLWLPWNSVAHAEPFAQLEDTYGNMDIDAISTTTPNPTTPPATSKKIVNRTSNLCLDDYNGVITPGAEVRQWTCNNLPEQDWNVTDTGDGYVQIANRNSALCLDNKDWGTAAGATVQQWTCNGLAVQQWRVVPAADGRSTMVNRHSGLCLDDYNGVTTPGAEVRQWTCNGLATQQRSIA
jgi:Ricin-type beta-trefoil lectin domain